MASNKAVRDEQLGLSRIGKRATVKLRKSVNDKNPLHIEVRIQGYRRSYGRHRYLVEPIAGSGQYWAEKVFFTRSA